MAPVQQSGHGAGPIQVSDQGFVNEVAALVIAPALSRLAQGGVFPPARAKGADQAAFPAPSARAPAPVLLPGAGTGTDSPARQSRAGGIQRQGRLCPAPRPREPQASGALQRVPTA